MKHDNGAIKIETGIPVPPSQSKNRALYEAVKKMEVGQSFLWPLAHRNNIGAMGRDLKMKFTTRAVDEITCRVWRVE